VTAELELLIRAPRVVSGGRGEPEQAQAIGVSNGRIEVLQPVDTPATAGTVLELGSDVVVLPGLIDPHVHLCEPGHTDWEGFATATRAAAAGGVTTLVDMPLDSVPATVTAETLAVKRSAAEGQCHVDVGFWGGVIPGNLGSLEPLHEAGVFGFKCFLTDSGLEEFPPLNARQVRDALAILRDLGSVLLVHAESGEAMAAIGEARGPS
jgi:allantoinase